MKIFLSLITVIASLQVHAECEFNSNLKKVISFSGTTTVLLREMGLLHSSKLQGISVFNPVPEGEFKGKVYPGGIFLSHNTFSGLKDALIFYDESRDLRKILSFHQIQSEEIRTRTFTPHETIQKNLGVLKKYINGCDAEIEKIWKKVKACETTILDHIKENPTIVFYLGSTLGQRPPEMLMVNDGIVKWLLLKNKIHTYPSELAYVNWSAKVMNQLPKNAQHIGILDSGEDFRKNVLKKNGKVTLEYPGSLVPGLSQLEAFAFLFEKL